MDDAILTAYEPAARIYCEKVGADPDVLVPGADQLFVGVQNLVPQWHSIALELHDISMRLVAIREAAALPKPEVH